MNLFITGIKSFVGKVLISKLKKYPQFNVHGCDLKIKNNNKFISADVRSKYFFKKIPKNIDTIIHLAAISRDKDCSDNPANCYLTNVVGTLNVIEAAKKLNIKKIIFASTEWVYPDFLAIKKATENSKIEYRYLKSDYARSKLISEIHLRDFYNLNVGWNVSILRFGIIYGERLINWSAVEAIFENIKKNKSINIGSFQTSRRFIHVDDICYGIINSIKLKKFNIINLQGSELITLKKLVLISQKILNKKVKVNEISPANPSIRNISNNKSNKIMNFKNRISLSEGLQRLNVFLNLKK